MSSLVLDLQQDVLNPGCDILNALRKAHLIAAKLGLNEFDSWIQLELNGYNLKEKDSIPEYRNVKGTLKAFNPYNGWISAQCPEDELEKMICEQKLWQSVGELQELYSQSSTRVFIYQFPAGQMEALSSLFDTPVPMQFALHISTHLLKSIIEKVKNCILEWTIRLEAEGIVGENMRFSKEETNSAKAVPQQINNYYGTVVNGDISKSQVVSGNYNTVSFSYEAAKELMHEVNANLEKESLLSDDMESAIELLKEVSAKIDAKKKPSVIKAALSGLKDYLIGVGASGTVAIIQAKMLGMF
ncbi:AbiTii domain-containing protein [Dethiobacter alkaliphilus]|uniref:AbiTii domain-containing protein n=1 Tax=Dethiobacter alkaliphilus TaxID=427926 RepID=UPI002226F9E4|nr:ABC transporter substrate-binding protein [Dethiobacter alkaliphilus]MCW3490235.1 ABC transporter substrate-binding protein [Dethiobacter alkaliphilus]